MDASFADPACSNWPQPVCCAFSQKTFVGILDGKPLFPVAPCRIFPPQGGLTETEGQALQEQAIEGILLYLLIQRKLIEHLSPQRLLKRRLAGVTAADTARVAPQIRLKNPGRTDR